MDRPSDSTPCGFCSDPFGIHFETYDGKKTGCTRTARDQRDDDCRCQGFALVHRYGQKQPTPSTNEQMYR